MHPGFTLPVCRAGLKEIWWACLTIFLCKLSSSPRFGVFSAVPRRYRKNGSGGEQTI